MKAYTVHAYTTDSTEGIILTSDDSLKSEQQLLQEWFTLTAEGKSTAEFADLDNLILVERPYSNH